GESDFAGRRTQRVGEVIRRADQGVESILTRRRKDDPPWSTVSRRNGLSGESTLVVEVDARGNIRVRVESEGPQEVRHRTTCGSTADRRQDLNRCRLAVGPVFVPLLRRLDRWDSRSVAHAGPPSPRADATP